MSRFLSLLLLLAILISTAPAARSETEIDAGVVAGLNVTRLETKIPGWKTSDFKTGFAGGAQLTFGAMPFLEVDLQLLYSQYGGKYSRLVDMDGNVLYDGDTQINLSYLQLPILIRLTFPEEGRRVVPGLAIGIAPSIKLSSTYQLKGPPPPSDVPAEDDLDWIKRNDNFLIVDLGVDIGAGKGKITVNLRFNKGLTNINENGPTDEDGEAYQMSNEGWSILAGYVFHTF